MLRKAIGLLILFALISLLVSLILAFVTIREDIDVKANLYKEISVASSDLAVLQDTHGTSENASKLMELKGTYSIECDSPFSQLNMTGRSLTLKDTPSLEVHPASNGMPVTESMMTNALTLPSEDRSFVELHQSVRFSVPYYGIVLIGPNRIATNMHDGKFWLSDKAVYSSQMQTGKIAAFDFSPNEHREVPVKALLRPSSDLRNRFVLMPMNDFQVSAESSNGNRTVSSVFEGQLMRVEGFYILSCRPFVDSRIEGIATNMIDPVFGLPCTIKIVGQKVDSLILPMVSGSIVMNRGKSTKKLENEPCEFVADSPITLVIEIRMLDSTKGNRVGAEFLIQGKVKRLLIDGQNWKSLSSELVKNTKLFWSNPYVVGLMTALYSVLLTIWIGRIGTSRDNIHGKSQRGRTKSRIPKD